MENIVKKPKNKAAILDTMIFDELLKNKEALEKLPADFKYIATSIQYEQIKNIPIDKSQHRNNLLGIFNEIVDAKIPSTNEEWFCFDNSSFDNSRFINDNEEEILANLVNNNPNNYPDALIILTALNLTAQYPHLIIVSNDKKAPFNTAKRILVNTTIQILSLQDFIDLCATI